MPRFWWPMAGGVLINVLLNNRYRLFTNEVDGFSIGIACKQTLISLIYTDGILLQLIIETLKNS